MNKEYLFVYGTLRKDCVNSMNHIFSQYATFLSYGFIYGKIYDINGYPGLIISKDIGKKEKVFGEIYKLINPEISFKILDDFEECSDRYPEPHEYIRVKSYVYLNNHKKLKAWVYQFNLPVKNFQLISSGNYTEYLKNKTKFS